MLSSSSLTPLASTFSLWINLTSLILERYIGLLDESDISVTFNEKLLEIFLYSSKSKSHFKFALLFSLILNIHSAFLLLIWSRGIWAFIIWFVIFLLIFPFNEKLNL